MSTHVLKLWAEYFEDMVMGHKSFEVRKNDRAYRLGDVLILEEFDPHANQHTGRVIRRKVAYILRGGQHGIEAGYVVLGLVGAPK